MNARSRTLMILVLVFLGPFSAAYAQVKDVTVAITPTCPQGFKACWPGIYYEILRLKGVKSVAENPDEYNCTARVSLTSTDLPDVRKWEEQFKASMGNQVLFRGVELTIEGELLIDNGILMLRSAELPRPLPLKKFEKKLQWNFYKRAARGFEDEERKAYDELLAKMKGYQGAPPAVRVTGPFDSDGQGMLEVREAFLLTNFAYPF